MAEGVGVAPTLVFGYGNPSRGDDALGWRLIEQLDALRAAGRLAGVDLLSDFQLQIEHVLDLRGRTRVIFVDAELGEAPRGPCPPWRWLAVRPEAELGWTSHAVDPDQLAGLFDRLYPDDRRPLLQVLAIRGRGADLGAGLSKPARANLASAVRMLAAHLAGMNRRRAHLR